MTDQKIISELQKGNTKAFSHLYDYFPLVLNHVLKNNGTQDDAKDLFQNALVIFYKKLKSGDYSYDSKISTYLFAICKNNWLKVLTRDKSRGHGDIEDVHIANPDESENDEGKNKAIALLKEAMEKLGDPCKTLIVFHEFHKMAWEEIASKMNYSNAHAARQQKYKCILRLKKLIPDQARTYYFA